MSLYRKYRPQTFADIVGQEHVVTTLENAAAQKKLAHAYLFAGGRGIGKTTAARILAKVLLTSGIEDEAVKRQIITGVEDGSLVDLVEIDAASNRGIDDVRELIEKIQFSPVAAAAKVYIVDEVHMLTREAFNALLKTLEEPPPYAYFILATTELHKIPATIQSRCQRFTFRQITDEDIVRRLQFIADTERIAVNREALRLIARASQGGMRDAISLLDQLRSLEQITEDDVQSRIGETGHGHVQEVFEALQNGDTERVIGIVRAIEDAGIALDVFARQLLAEARRQLHAAADAKASLTAPLQQTESLLTAIREIRIAPVPGLALEAALLRMAGVTPAAPPAMAAPAAIRVPEVKPAATVIRPAGKTEAKPEPKKEEPAATVTFEAPEMSVQQIQKSWLAIQQHLKTPSVRMSLKNGRALEIRSGVLRIGFASAFHRDKVKATDASRQVEEAIHAVFKQPLKIECVLDGGPGPAAEADESMVNLAEAASEVF